MSSTILYLAIVAIWAGVLVPRWLRREPYRETAHSRRTDAAPESEPGEAETAANMTAGDHLGEDARSSRGNDAELRISGPGRARVIAARRRLFGILVALTFAAVTIAAAGLATWWVAVPPVCMLAGYVALLREATRADAELRAAQGAADEGESPVTAERREARVPAERRAARDDAAYGGARQRVSTRRAAGAAAAEAGVPESIAAVNTLDGVDETGAEVVDITSRVDEELYDQYADAKLRAVGD